MSISLFDRHTMVLSHSAPVLILIFVAGLGGTVGPSPAGKQTSDVSARPDTVTVEQAVQEALRANPTIQAAEQGATAAAASVREARRAWFPEVSGQASYRRQSGNVDYTVELPGQMGNQPVTFAPAILNRYSTRASVTQPLLTGFRLPHRHDAAQVPTEAALAEAVPRE